MRVAELAQDTQQVGLALNSVVVDRYLGIIGAVGDGAGRRHPWPGTAAGVLLMTAALFRGGAAGGLAAAPTVVGALGGRADLIGRAVRAADACRVMAEAIPTRTMPDNRDRLGISLAFNVLQIGWNMAIARGLGYRLPPATYLVLVPLTALALLLPAFGGLGVRELTYVGLFGQVGVPAPTAVALSLGVYGITVGDRAGGRGDVPGDRHPPNTLQSQS